MKTLDITEDLPMWAQILAAVLSSSSVTVLAGAVRERMLRGRQQRVTDAYQDIQDVYNVIQALLHECSGSSVLVMESRNGGGIPVPGSDVKIRVMHEVYEDAKSSVPDQWRQMAIDAGFARVLADLSSAGWAVAARDELDISSRLRDLMTTIAVVDIRFARVCVTKSEIFYVAVCYSGEEHEDDEMQLRQCARRLEVIFRRHHSVLHGAV